MKAFYGKRALELRYANKETVDIDILTTSRSSDSQIMQFIRATSRPRLRIKEMELVESVQMNIYQSHACRK